LVKSPYVAALKYRRLTPLYDRTVQWLMPEASFRAQLLNLCRAYSPARVLDIGCGTASLTFLLEEQFPAAEIIGLDGDPEILALARDKAIKRGSRATFVQGLCYELPFPDQSLDIVTSSLLFHHLTTADKRRTFAEVARVLRSGGRFLLADWGKPDTRMQRASFLLVQLLDGFETTGDNVRGHLPLLMQEANLEIRGSPVSHKTALGTLTTYCIARQNDT
jgi:ubiquinone/menaquinone biosynthesis C-methylase UbiE